MASENREGVDDDILDLGFLPLVGRRNDTPMTMVGKLIAGKSGNPFAICEVMCKAFRPKGKLTTRHWGSGLIVFSFDMESDMVWVLQNQPWNFDGNLFVVKRLATLEQPSLVHLTTITFWVRAHDLPLACRSESVIRSIASKVGKLVMFENPLASDPLDFVRFKMEFDILQPLLRGLHMKVGGVVLNLNNKNSPNNRTTE
ncbi:hypothetical protein ACS0TY_022557 [Phlomoides rotata]